MLALYHTPNAVCAQKVRICLAEKGLAWESRLVAGPDLRSPEYLALNPGGYVPTLVHDARILTESRIISEYLDEAFPDPALMPSDAFDRARSRHWSKQVDDSLHLNVFVLTCALIFRPIIARLTPEEQEVRLPLELTKRERARDLVAKGVQSHYVPAAVKRFAKLTAEMEQALQRSEWLAGDRYSLADADLTPYLQRLSDLGLAVLWSDKPALSDWWARVQARPSFAAVQADWMSAEAINQARAAAEQGAAAFTPHLEAA